MEFQEQMRRLGKRHVGIIDIHPLHLHFVEKLDPRHRQADLHGIYRRIHRAIDRLEGAGGCHNRLGLAEQAHGDAGD